MSEIIKHFLFLLHININFGVFTYLDGLPWIITSLTGSEQAFFNINNKIVKRLNFVLKFVSFTAFTLSIYHIGLFA